MTDDTSHSPQPDPRQERFVVDTSLLTEDQLQGLVEEYCTRYHGLNDVEDPLSERARVLAAVRKGELVVWFDPVENSAGLGRPA
ncbi:hypothetical protein [Marinobacter lutaoensis]|jgi:uncharacterized protein YheU (UPF0270 family)|uniref:YheU family protein n=1 Tax=Marinobacter lutaoensis TaxID=135739 RepID=A0A1V2DTS4_9GAMM|nr:hypothetical protein [Marinobacter lutaoensis]MBE02395.1 hypothetical protein [Marinobacter sp.]MBI43848.1 hypothetical protein [Oceanospirillales bacterium]NVD34989.1 hypothetical protein [Marinobacter lutaoensis]ONF44052.1 hypothetical protein BTO32_07100 [Marinobacter lutaoensis]|tara:strand:- start:3343 stop:3594 length:252 start_codon:yes stop_codon:yes gene_type:complete